MEFYILNDYISFSSVAVWQFQSNSILLGKPKYWYKPVT